MEKLKSLLLVACILALSVIGMWYWQMDPVMPVAHHKYVLDSLTERNESINKEYAWRIDSLTFATQNKDSSIKVLQVQTTAWKKAALEQADTARAYITLYRMAKAELDTASMLANCDELVDSYEDLHNSFLNYMVSADSLHIATLQTIALRDSTISQYKAKDSISRQTITDLKLNYSNLIVDYTKLDRKRKGGKWIDRIGGFVAGFVLGSLVK